MTVKLWRGTELRSRKKHYTFMVGLWLYTLMWISPWIVVGLGWRPNLPFIIQVLLLILLIIGTPSLGDLFYSYSKYEEEWRRDGEQNCVQVDEPEMR